MTNFDYRKFLKENKLNEAAMDVATVAQAVADAFTADDPLDIKYVITPGSVEGDLNGGGFDLDAEAGPNTPGEDWEDENGFGIDYYLGKYAGGSFVIKNEGDVSVVKNAAMRNAIIAYVTPEGEIDMVYNQENHYNTMSDKLTGMKEAEEAKKSNKMKKSELKELIKASLTEYEKDVNVTDEDPQSEEDFLAEADEEVDAETTDTEIDTPEGDAEIETTDVETTAEVDPNVKAAQDSLTQAMKAAKALGDKKLQDQIGNTITFFTRTHVANAEKGAMAEAEENIEEGIWSVVPSRIPEFIQAVEDLKDEYHGIVGSDDVFDGLDAAISAAQGLLLSSDEMAEGKKEYYKDAEADDAEHIKALEKDMADDKKDSMKIGEVLFPMWTKINNK